MIMAYTLPDLPYDYDALEPHIDARTMNIHHTKHHQGYTNNLNNALAGTGYEDGATPIETVLFELASQAKSSGTPMSAGIRNNGGGYANHCLFWEVMGPNGGGDPSGTLASALINSFGSVEAFRSQFASAAGTRFGSGWAWLVHDPNASALSVYSTANQDSPHMDGHTPLLGLDVWEHAYYLNYQNRRPDYVKAFWNVVNWDAVAARYEAAVSAD